MVFMVSMVWRGEEIEMEMEIMMKEGLGTEGCMRYYGFMLITGILITEVGCID